MAIKITPLTKRQLVEYFQVYREAFPDWAVEHDVMLTRTHGPIKQLIDFQAQRSGAYRPSGGVRILLPIPDGCSILHQYLDVKHREILPREHPSKWPLVLKAMEEQFVPPIRKPLDVAETLRFGEEEAIRDRIDNMNYTMGLAAINAYLGNAERAIYWCHRVEERAANMGRPLADWEIRKKDFAHELREALEAGHEGELLRQA
jgi:hypothetical protein